MLFVAIMRGIFQRQHSAGDADKLQAMVSAKVRALPSVVNGDLRLRILAKQGGGGVSEWNPMRRWIKNNAGAGHTLLCAGKSFGGWNLAGALRWHERRNVKGYDKIGLLTVDPQNLRHNNNDRYLPVPRNFIDVSYNIYQTGQQGGYRLNPHMYDDHAYMRDLEIAHPVDDADYRTTNNAFHKKLEYARATEVNAAIDKVLQELGV